MDSTSRATCLLIRCRTQEYLGVFACRQTLTADQRRPLGRRQYPAFWTACYMTNCQRLGPAQSGGCRCLSELIGSIAQQFVAAYDIMYLRPALHVTIGTVQVYEPGKGLAFHFDKDEHAMKENQQMIQPVLSSVLYLTGDSTQERLGMRISTPAIMQVSGLLCLRSVDGVIRLEMWL